MFEVQLCPPGSYTLGKSSLNHEWKMKKVAHLRFLPFPSQHVLFTVLLDLHGKCLQHPPSLCDHIINCLSMITFVIIMPTRLALTLLLPSRGVRPGRPPLGLSLPPPELHILLVPLLVDDTLSPTGLLL